MDIYSHTHLSLGQIAGRKVGHDLAQFRSLPYASIPQRFARSVILNTLPTPKQDDQGYYNAVDYGPCSVQPKDSLETDIRWNQLPPESDERAQPQAEDCLRVTLTVPLAVLEANSSSVPVVVFIHGGALIVGSGEREYYDPTNFCANAVKSGHPIIFASIDYRLGALGFLHSPEVSDLLPPTNGLYDQVQGFKWLRAFLPGFGGDPDNITAIGQSAGAASLSLHSSHPRKEQLYRRAIILSGSSVVLVTMSPEEHQAEFLHQAEKLGIQIKDRSAEQVALDIIKAPVEAIRSLNFTGAPCSRTELIPSDDWATMQHARHSIPNPWLQSQLLSSCTFDGSISYMVALGQERKDLAKVFIAICENRMKNSSKLLSIYDISADDADETVLEKICQIVTDLGFYNAAVSHAIGAAPHVKTYVQLFDVPNPFRGLLKSGCFATHTWDVVALLGPYDHLVPENIREVIAHWRHLVIDYCYSGSLPLQPWSQESLSMLLVKSEGVEYLGREQVAAARASRLMQLAEEEGGDQGADILWDKVVRFFLKTGSPRYAHEAEELLNEGDIGAPRRCLRDGLNRADATQD